MLLSCRWMTQTLEKEDLLTLRVGSGFEKALTSLDLGDAVPQGVEHGLVGGVVGTAGNRDQHQEKQSHHEPPGIGVGVGVGLMIVDSFSISPPFSRQKFTSLVSLASIVIVTPSPKVQLCALRDAPSAIAGLS